MMIWRYTKLDWRAS